MYLYVYMIVYYVVSDVFSVFERTLVEQYDERPLIPFVFSVRVSPPPPPLPCDVVSPFRM